MKRLVYILLCLMLVASCERRLLEERPPGYTCRIEIDWSESFGEGNKPSGASVWLYPHDGSSAMFERTADPDYIELSLGVGVYDVVVFNLTPSELSSTLGFRGTSDLSTLEVYTQPVGSVSSWYASRADYGVTVKPEDFAITVYRDLEVTQQMYDQVKLDYFAGIDQTIETLATVVPEDIIKNIKVNILADGYQNLLDTRGAISNMAEGYMVDSETVNTIAASHMLDEGTWLKEVDEGAYSTGKAYVYYVAFGLQGDETASRSASDYDYWSGTLDIEMMLVDSESTIMAYSIGVNSSHISTIDEGIEEGLDLEITVGPVTLPDVEPAGGTSGGFDANVNDWEDEEKVDVPL